MAITHKKIKLALILFAASFSHFSLAQVSPLETDTEISSEGTPPSSLEKNAMVWSLMPGESVNRLAKLFYPKDKSMQRLFVKKTLYLSRKIQPDLQGDTTFSHLTSVVIPNIKQLSQQSISSTASKNYADSIQTQTRSLQNNGIQLVALELNPKIQFIYDALVKKNEFLKLEINKINAKLAYLEQVFVTLKAEIIRLADSNNAPLDSGVNTQLKAQALAETATVQPIQAGQSNANALQNNEAKITHSQPKPLLIPAASTKSIPVKTTFDSSYLFLSVFNFLLVISCLVGFVLFSRRQAKNQPFPTTSKFVTTRSDEIRKKSLMIKDKLETQKKNKILKENMPAMSDAFTHSMPGAEERPDTSTIINSQTTPEAVPEVAISPVKLMTVPVVKANVIAKVTPSVALADQSYDKEEAELLLGQAKIFVQVDRAGYAIRLLKAQIEAAPKASLQHWLYLLDIYRETKQKEEFLQYAKQLHQNFNVMMPLWENTPPQTVIASSLEEFSHITAKVTKLWADCQKEVNSLMQTKAYLDELLTDNRDSQRTGFSMEVFQEIMTLRDLLDEREKSTKEEMEMETY